jgi:CopG-like RHH_1 or ribbon-helix-helix domain, RHH_5
MSSITKPSQKAFIQAAPDARPAKAKKAAAASTQITLTLADDVLDRLDTMAKQTGQSRSGLIKTGIARVLRDGL